MLPDFPELKSELEKLFLFRLQQRSKNLDPVLAQVRRFTQREGQDMRYDRIGAPAAEGAPEKIEAIFEIKLDEVPDLIGPRLEAKLDEMARAIAEQEAKLFFKKVGETCNEVGNVVDAGGQPLSAKLLLDAIESTEMNFDRDGNPKSQFVIHPDMAPAVKKANEEFENDPELKRRHEDILRRKREDWLSRQNNRKLVD
jgi:hypothetical protein